MIRGEHPPSPRRPTLKIHIRRPGPSRPRTTTSHRTTTNPKTTSGHKTTTDRKITTDLRITTGPRKASTHQFSPTATSLPSRPTTSSSLRLSTTAATTTSTTSRINATTASLKTEESLSLGRTTSSGPALCPTVLVSSQRGSSLRTAWRTSA